MTTMTSFYFLISIQNQYLIVNTPTPIPPLAHSFAQILQVWLIYGALTFVTKMSARIKSHPNC